MGEYARNRMTGESFKIGTCESMTDLRRDQLHLIEPEENSLDPREYADRLRFRFPFPDEDDVRPGQFDNWDRGYRVEGYTGHEVVEHRASCTEPGCEVIMEKNCDGLRVVVCRCTGCRQMYRLPELEHALPLLAAILTHDNTEFGREMVTRIAAGYGD
jgi:hypothetical protein